MKRSIPIVTLVVGAALGALAHAALAPVPAYVLVSGRTLDVAGLEPYRQAAGPAAVAAGMEMLARAEAAEVQVLEGRWPYRGFIALERYRSMDDLLQFWNSDTYQAAIALRLGKVELDFVVAFEPD